MDTYDAGVAPIQFMDITYYLKILEPIYDQVYKYDEKVTIKM